jgi:hypothetical protein
MPSILKTSVTVAAFLTLVGAGVGQTFAQQPAAKAEPKAPPPKASSSGGEETAQFKAKTVYDFDDDNVEGDLQRPDGELIDSVRKVKHSSLIEIRKDFIPEMLKSLEDV